MKAWRHILLLGLALSAQAVEFTNPFPTGDRPGLFAITEENDKFSPTNKDRYYTQGIKFSMNAGEHAYVALSQELNTPADTTVTNPLLTDLPYSTALYVTYGYGAILDRGGKRDCMWAVEVQAGLVGPDAGGFVQNAVHRVLGMQQAVGWATQMPDEAILNFNAEFRRKFDLDPTGRGMRDLIVREVVELGTLRTEFVTGAQLRWGVNLKNSWGHTYIRDSSSYAPPQAYEDIATNRPFAYWAFIDSEILVVLRNYATDGTLFAESRSVARVPIVAQLAVGTSLQVYHLSVSYFAAVRTREFETQDGYHYFAGLEATYRF